MTLVSEADATVHLKTTISDLGIAIDTGGDCFGSWTLVMETSGVKAEGICSPAVPSAQVVEDAINQTGELQGSVKVEQDTATKKIYSATMTVQGGVTVNVKYIYTKN